MSVEFSDIPEAELAICRCVMPIVSERGDDVAIPGTAVLIESGMAITAAHVVDEIFGIRLEGEEEIEISDVAVSLVESGDNTSEMFIWCVTGYACHPELDLAVLGVMPHPELSATQSSALKPRVINMEPPKVGEVCVAFGYPDSSAHISVVDGRRQMNTSVTPKRSSGVVTAVYPEGRDNVMMPCPCFESDARVEGGMSGGGVFVDGKLCGLISSGIRASEESNSETSYLSLLWPLLDLPKFHHPTLGYVSFKNAISAKCTEA